MRYHCPDCNRTVDKETFGWPVCCGSTMKQGDAPRIQGQQYPNQNLWHMVEELDVYAGNENVTDWELDFIGDMHNLCLQKRSYTVKQRDHIIRLWEKYCA